MDDGGGDEEVEVGDCSLGAVVFEEPFESPEVAEAGNFSFALDLSDHSQATDDEGIAVGDDNGGLGLTGIEDWIDNIL